jgi:hypothetical protein
MELSGASRGEPLQKHEKTSGMVQGDGLRFFRSEVGPREQGQKVAQNSWHDSVRYFSETARMRSKTIQQKIRRE